MADFQSKTRLIAAVVHDVLANESFETLADVSAAVCARCARLKLPYDAEVVTKAIAFVNHRRPALKAPPAPISRQERAAEPEIGRRDAAEVLARLGIARSFRSMPQVERTTPRQRDRQKAMSFVEAEMLASMARCAALEAEIDK